MPASGSSIFTDADGYQASLRDMLDLLVLRPGDFHARLTWVELPRLSLLRAQEASARLAYVTLPPELVFVGFPTQRGPPLIHDGAQLQFGDIVFHSRGEHWHQRTTAASSWGCISLTPATLMAFGRTIANQNLVAPQVGTMMRPAPADRQRLLRLHAQAGRIAETNLDRIGHKEVVRALEQDLIWALITCLTTGKAQEGQPVERRYASILVRLEAMLAAQPYRLLRMRDICSSTGVSERTLRAACAKLLGMSAGRYQRLRRLKLVRAELMRGHPATTSSVEVMQRYGFANFHSFVTEYWNVYGEMPPIAPRDPANG